MQRHNGPPIQRRHLLRQLELVKCSPALLHRPPRPPRVRRIEQAIVPREFVPLNPPLAIDQLIAPELLSPQRLPGEIHWRGDLCRRGRRRLRLCEEWPAQSGCEAKRDCQPGLHTSHNRRVRPIISVKCDPTIIPTRTHEAPPSAKRPTAPVCQHPRLAAES